MINLFLKRERSSHSAIIRLILKTYQPNNSLKRTVNNHKINHLEGASANCLNSFNSESVITTGLPIKGISKSLYGDTN